MSPLMSRKWFRFLLLLGWVVPLTGLVSYFAEKSSMPPELRDYLAARAARPMNGRDYFAALLVLFLFGAQVVITVGLYRFRRWGRTLFLCSCVVGYSALPFVFGGPVTTTRVAHVFYALGSLLNGFTLALAYFSPLARFFEPEPDARV
jgi:hypothetical protein